MGIASSTFLILRLNCPFMCSCINKTPDLKEAASLWEGWPSKDKPPYSAFESGVKTSLSLLHCKCLFLQPAYSTHDYC